MDSDADPSSGQTAVFTLGATHNLTLDAGLYRTASWATACGTIGTITANRTAVDLGIGDVGVYLYDAQQSLVDVQITDADGLYAFSGLPAGVYVIQFEEPDGYAFTKLRQGGNAAVDSDADPNTGETPPITLTTGHKMMWGPEARLVRLGAMGDQVWYDANQNGIQNIGESGVANVPLSLYRDSNNNNGTLEIGVDALTATRVTSANGEYIFNGLARRSTLWM